MSKNRYDFSDRFKSSEEAMSQMFGGPKVIVQELPVDLLTDYPDQPFRAYTEDKLAELAADIGANGIISPLSVRSMPGGTYQILAGHNRRAAARLAGLDKVPCIVRDVDDDAAALIVVNTNLNQRDELLPSEKAKAYKIQLEALKHQGKSTSRQFVGKSESADAVGEMSGERGRQIQRYIRLNNLVPELLELVDTKKNPADRGRESFASS